MFRSRHNFASRSRPISFFRSLRVVKSSRSTSDHGCLYPDPLQTDRRPSCAGPAFVLAARIPHPSHLQSRTDLSDRQAEGSERFARQSSTASFGPAASQTSLRVGDDTAGGQARRRFRGQVGRVTAVCTITGLQATSTCQKPKSEGGSRRAHRAGSTDVKADSLELLE